MNPTTQPSEGAVRAAEWILSTFTGTVHPLHVARIGKQIDQETGVEELATELRADAHWIENILCDINAGRPLRPHQISEGLTLRLASIRAALSRHTSTQGKEGKL